MAYFDHAATTAILPVALEAMLPWLTTFHGNPSGVHCEARRARQALEEAREEVAGELGARPHEVVFTSGGTEALNLAVFGVDVESISLSAIEHEAVRRSAVARFHQRPRTFGGAGL